MKKIMLGLVIAGSMLFSASFANAGIFGLSLQFGGNRQNQRQEKIVVERQVVRHAPAVRLEFRSPIRVKLQEPIRVREEIVVEKVIEKQQDNHHHHNNVQQFKEVQRIVRDQYGRERIVVERVRVR